MLGRDHPYQKGTPFNACLLFGVHITATGQINPRASDTDATQLRPYLSRGSSQLWHTFPHNHSSAWSKNSTNTLRLTFNKGQIVGALIIGEQTLADPLHALINAQADLSAIQPQLAQGYPQFKTALLNFWEKVSALPA